MATIKSNTSLNVTVLVRKDGTITIKQSTNVKGERPDTILVAPDQILSLIDKLSGMARQINDLKK